MRNLFLLFFLCGYIVSCDNRNVDGLSYSGTICLSDASTILEIEGKSILVELQDTISNISIQTKTREVGWQGPFYAKGEEELYLSNQKVYLKSEVVPSYYICDVYKFSNRVYLPAGITYGKVEMPKYSGYSDYGKQTLGVNWNYDETSNTIYFYFYTIVVKSNMLGQTYNKVIPRSGGSVQIPYYYMY